jgi:hypothetical protein
MIARHTSVSLLIILLSSCSCQFDSETWDNDKLGYDRYLQVKGFLNCVKLGDHQSDIISMIGETEVVCDSSNLLYGTFECFPPFDHGSFELVDEGTRLYNLLVRSPCSDTLTLDRYVIGFNGSGPDYLLLSYDKDRRLTAAMFEATSY